MFVLLTQSVACFLYEARDEAADEGGRRLVSGRVEEVGGYGHNVLEPGLAGGVGVGGDLVGRHGDVGPQTLPATLQDGVVVGGQGDLDGRGKTNLHQTKP